jgi:SAM-dependent methyltransferase
LETFPFVSDQIIQRQDRSRIEPKPDRNGLSEHVKMRRAHWDRVAETYVSKESLGRFYHRYLARIYQFLIPPGLRVLEVGSGSGDLLAAVHPRQGVGLDISGKMVADAQRRHPELNFIQADGHNLPLSGTFDAIILSDLVNDVWDVQRILEQLHSLCEPRTRLVLNYYSRVWQPLLMAAEWTGLARPKLPQNWLTHEDLANLLYLAGFEIIRTRQEILWPLPVRILDVFFNRFLVKLWPFKLLALTNLLIARPAPEEADENSKPTVSVIIPARNEAGNIPHIFARVPEMGAWTELIFVEGHSKDKTNEIIQQEIAHHPERRCKLLKQTGKGKGDAVRLGFAQASGDVLMILDADLTVPPEDLPRFYQALISGKGELVNGVRLVYPMADQAMRFFNFLGNKFFSLAFSWLLEQPVKDTLCGTKVISRRDYESLAANRAYFGDFDPFGDFDLLFGAARLNLKIVDLPVHYGERTYGTTNIQRWKHGWLLLRMVAFAAFRLKFT